MNGRARISVMVFCDGCGALLATYTAADVVPSIPDALRNCSDAVEGPLIEFEHRCPPPTAPTSALRLVKG